MQIKTRYYKMDEKIKVLSHIHEAARALQQGGTVAFPTETVYGLGANAFDPKAIKKIFIAKGRPSDNPLIVHIANLSMLDELVSEIPEQAKLLMEKFWPGPLTLIFPKSEKVPIEVTAGLDTVAIRMPDHPVALALLKAAKVPIAAPSANISGRPSPTTGEHVLRDLKGKIDIVLDGGKAQVGVESTVLDLTGKVPMILRPGGVTLEVLKELLGEVIYDPAIRNDNLHDLTPKAPGMKYTHYAPKAKVSIVMGAKEQVAIKFKELAQEARQQGLRVGIMCTEDMLFVLKDLNDAPNHLEILGKGSDLGEIANRLYGALRNCDRYGLDVVYTQGFKEEELGVAIMNRLKKAAGNRCIQV
jgi:L-threonylcarbamoyladenylate synthase